MTAKKRAVKEPFLSAVARRLGRAAGTLTHAAHELTENFAALPVRVTSKSREAVGETEPREKKQFRRSRSAVHIEAVAKKRRRTGGKTKSVSGQSKRVSRKAQLKKR